MIHRATSTATVSTMAPRRRPRSDELWRGYRRPLRRDRALWIGLGVAAMAVVIEFALARPSTPLGWAAFTLIALAVVALIVTLNGILVGVFRGFADGWRANRAKPAVARPTSPSPEGAAATTGAAPQGDQDARGPGDPAAPDPAGPSLSIPPLPDSVKNLAAAAKARTPTSQDVDRTARPRARAAGAARRAYRKEP